MNVYVYETPAGLIADFRAYLDGSDRAFEPARALPGNDPRWEKILNTNDPRTGEGLHGRTTFVGTGEIDDYHELLVFPAAFEGTYEPAGEVSS